MSKPRETFDDLEPRKTRVQSLASRIGKLTSTKGKTTSNDKPWQFKKGNKGGPGNPQAGRVQEYRTMCSMGAPPHEIMSIMQTMVLLAKAGDVAAAKVVFERTMGKVPDELYVNEGTPPAGENDETAREFE